MIEHYRNALSTIFKDFLYYLSLEGMELLLREADDNGWGLLSDEVRGLVNLGFEANLSLAEAYMDEESSVAPVTSLLWKQRLGIVPGNVRFSAEFRSLNTACHPHRYMVANGWRVESLRLHTFGAGSGGYLSRLIEIVGSIDKTGSRFKVLEQNLDLLLNLLSVLGPQIDRLDLRELAEDVVRFTVEKGPSLEVGVYPWTALVYDTKFPREEAWDSFKRLLQLEMSTYSTSFPAWFLGAKMFGERVFAELERHRVVVPVEVLVQLDQLCPWPAMPKDEISGN